MLLSCLIAFGSIWLIMLHKPRSSWRESAGVAPPGSRDAVWEEIHLNRFNWAKDEHQSWWVRFRKILVRANVLLSPPPLHGWTLLSMGGLVTPHPVCISRGLPPRYLQRFSMQHRNSLSVAVSGADQKQMQWRSRLSYLNTVRLRASLLTTSLG